MARLRQQAALLLLCLMNAVAHLHPAPEQAGRWNDRVYQGIVSPRGRTVREPGHGGGGAAGDARRRLRPIALSQASYSLPTVHGCPLLHHLLSPRGVQCWSSANAWSCATAQVLTRHAMADDEPKQWSVDGFFLSHSSWRYAWGER